MRNFHRFQIAALCLAFTGIRPASADPDVVPKEAPNATFGSTVRVGTSAGVIYGSPDPVVALGLQAAAGQRFGRLGLEAEYTLLGFQERQIYNGALGDTDGSVMVGRGQRIAALARWDLVRLGPQVDGTRRTLVTIYVEGGAGIAWNHWTRPQASDAGSRVIPDDTKRTEGQGGFGLMIFPHRVAWLLGWRFAVTPHEPMTGSVCRGVSCRVVDMPVDNSLLDRSMLFQSSLEFTF